MVGKEETIGKASEGMLKDTGVNSPMSISVKGAKICRLSSNQLTYSRGNISLGTIHGLRGKLSILQSHHYSTSPKLNEYLGSSLIIHVSRLS